MSCNNKLMVKTKIIKSTPSKEQQTKIDASYKFAYEYGILCDNTLGGGDCYMHYCQHNYKFIGNNCPQHGDFLCNGCGVTICGCCNALHRKIFCKRCNKFPPDNEDKTQIEGKCGYCCENKTIVKNMNCDHWFCKECFIDLEGNNNGNCMCNKVLENPLK